MENIVDFIVDEITEINNNILYEKRPIANEEIADIKDLLDFARDRYEYGDIKPVDYEYIKEKIGADQFFPLNDIRDFDLINNIKDTTKYNFSYSLDKNQTYQGLEDWNKTFTREDDNTVVIRAKDDFQIVGQVALELWPEDKCAYLFGLSVKPDIRNEGLGSILMQKAEDYAKDCKLEELRLRVEPKFENKLIPFYKKRGWKIQFYDNNYKDWVMTKFLN